MQFILFKIQVQFDLQNEGLAHSRYRYIPFPVRRFKILIELVRDLFEPKNEKKISLNLGPRKIKFWSKEQVWS